jgi:hypothetical protein
MVGLLGVEVNTRRTECMLTEQNATQNSACSYVVNKITAKDSKWIIWKCVTVQTFVATLTHQNCELVEFQGRLNLRSVWCHLV